MSSPPYGLFTFPPVVCQPFEPHVTWGNAGRSNAEIAASQAAPKTRRSAFTLVELLVVMGIIILILGLTIPAFNSLKGGRDITTAAYDIAGTLEQARAYAMANRTYVWVGFFEEDGSKASVSSAAAAITPPGIGRVVMCVTASKDGTRYRDTKVDSDFPKAFGAADITVPPTNPVTLIQLNKLVKIDNTHLTAANIGGNDLTVDTANSPDRPIVQADYQMGDAQGQTPTDSGPFAMHNVGGSINPVKNPTTFSYPLGSNATGSAVTPQYTFTKIIEFNPQGEASKIVESILNGTPAWMEIAVVPARGNVVDSRYMGSGTATKSAAVVQVGGLNGRMRIFRP